MINLDCQSRYQSYNSLYKTNLEGKIKEINFDLDKFHAYAE